MEKINAGAAQHGNFINYYTFNSAAKRIEVLPNVDIWTPSTPVTDTLILLDIGCNAGDFTQLIYEFITRVTGKKVHVLGIDLDPVLILRANETNKHPKNVEYRCLDFMNCPDVAFTEFLKNFNRISFNAVFCMSITLWIHLNNGDKGLQEFLKRASDLSELLIIEAQPWKCYKSAVSRRKKLKETPFENFKTLEWRENILDEMQLFVESKCKRRMIFESPPTDWERKVRIFEKKVD